MITVRTRTADNQIVIEVQDTGCGIPHEIRNRIFDPFFTTKDVGKGTGQGLAICYNIVVNLHHGTLDVESTPDIGTCFIVTLPLSQQRNDGSQQIDQQFTAEATLVPAFID
jgi:two-component system, NtrC family, sensor kinase